MREMSKREVKRKAAKREAMKRKAMNREPVKRDPANRVSTKREPNEGVPTEREPANRESVDQRTNSSWLPTLVLNQIFGYLNVKQRTKCKLVCRVWKEEIELREQNSDTLIMHLGPFRWNMHWSQANNGGLMKFESSLDLKDLQSMQHLLNRPLLSSIKKLAILNFVRNPFEGDISSVQWYIGHLRQCEEIELLNFQLRGTLTFDLPKLRTLAIKDSPADKLVLNCPSLEVLFASSRIREIDFRSTKKLKRLICYGWPVKVSLRNKVFQSLEYLNLLVGRGEPVEDRLLDRMPKLKRFVIYSNNLLADLEIIREQQKRLGLSDLEILPSGFREPVEIAVDAEGPLGFLRIDRCTDVLFENYSKLVESSPWKVWIDYSALFSKFKILPSDFVDRFGTPFEIEISEVTSHSHLYQFLRCYPCVQQLKLHSFSKLKADRILDLMLLLQPPLQRVTIVEEHPSELLKINFSFMSFFDLVQVKLKSTRMPADCIRQVMARAGPHFNGFLFTKLTHCTNGHRLGIHQSPHGILLTDKAVGSKMFASIEELIDYARTDSYMRTYLLE